MSKEQLERDGVDMTPMHVWLKRAIDPEIKIDDDGVGSTEYWGAPSNDVRSYAYTESRGHVVVEWNCIWPELEAPELTYSDHDPCLPVDIATHLCDFACSCDESKSGIEYYSCRATYAWGPA